MELVAKARGFYRGRLVEAGESFEAHEGFSGKWAVPKAEYKAEKPEDEATLLGKAKEALHGRRAPEVSKKTKKQPKKAKKKPSEDAGKKT